MTPMIKKLKPGKISIVVFLTALIWVWADLAQDDRLTLSDVRIEVAKSTDPSLWVNFVVEQADPNLQTSVALDTVVLKGPASRVTEARGRKNRGTLDLNLFLVPEQQGLTQTDVRTIDVLEFLRENEEIRKLGLTIEKCEPQRLIVITQKLVEQFVPVVCDGFDASLQVANLDPSTVAAYVPPGRALQARIPRLNAEEQNLAKVAAIERTPYVELVTGQRREVAAKVKITLAPKQRVLGEDWIPVAYGFCFSPNLQGKYRVVLENAPTELTGVMVRGTAEARTAYHDMDYQLVLNIRDQDVQVPADQGPIKRAFKFEFPEEYVQRGEIEATGQPPEARFTLVPIPTEASPEPTSLESTSLESEL